MRIVKDGSKQMEYPSSQSTPSSSSASSLAPATDTSSVCSGSGESFSEPSSLLSRVLPGPQAGPAIQTCLRVNKSGMVEVAKQQACCSGLTRVIHCSKIK